MNALHELSDDELVAEARHFQSARSFWRAHGYKSGSTYRKLIRPRLEAVGFTFSQSVYQPKRRYTVDTIQKASQSATSVSDVCRNLGILPEGRQHHHISKLLKSLGIIFDISKSGRNRSRPLSHYLVANGPYINTSKLKKKLIQAGLKENKCEKCGLLPIWMGEQLTLHLDHIDGDHNNRSIENLRILCPNCHSQTPTYGVLKTKPRPQ